MAENSSTSNSENEDLPPGLPKAFLYAIVIVLVVELFIRALGPRPMNPYALGENEYDSVAAALADKQLANISFVGTSREREAITLPIVREMVHEKFRQRLAVSNYSTAGARAAEIEVIVETMLKAGKPSLVMYGVQPRTLLGLEENPSRMSVFWNIADYERYHTADPNRYDTTLLPNVIRAELGTVYRTLRYRARPTAMVLDLYEVFGHPRGDRRVQDVLNFEHVPNPVLGDLTFWQRYQQQTSLVTRHISEDHVEAYVKTVMENGRYEFTQRKIDQLSRTLQLLHKADVPVVLFEVPISAILERHLPPGTMQDFRRILREVASETKTSYVSVEELGVSFDDSEFLEQSHLNIKGATRLTTALTEKIIIPTLESRRRATNVGGIREEYKAP